MGRKILLGLVALLIVMAGGVAGWATTFPCNQTPGFLLLSDVPKAPVTDWRFVNAIPLCQLQVYARPLPPPVNLNCRAPPQGERSAQAVADLPPSPGISARAIDYGDPEGLAATLRGAGCVVHLAGILFEGPTSSYQTANVDATQAVVDACKTAGVPRVVLVSVL